MKQYDKKKDKKEIEVGQARCSWLCKAEEMDGTHQTQEVKKMAKVFRETKYSIGMSNIDREEDNQAQNCYICGHELVVCGYKPQKPYHYMCPNCDI